MSIRLFGTGIILSSALTLNGSLSLYKQATATTYTAAFSTTLAAGNYDLFTFAAKVNSQVRQALITNKHASITAPALASVLFKFVFPTTWSATPGANKINCTFDPTGFIVTAGGTQTTISAFTLTNGAGSSWASYLGLALETTTTATATLTPGTPLGTLATFTGVFQPRSIFCFENSFKDSWDYERRPSEATVQLTDGKVRHWGMGSVETFRDITLVDQLADIAGYPLDAMVFSAFGANRGLVNIQAPDIDGLTNVSGLADNSVISVDDIVRVGNDDFWSRVSAKTSTLVTICQYYPTATVPTAGDTVWKISEAHALWIEAYRTQYLFVYEPLESTVGGSTFKVGAYRLQLDGRSELNFQRLDDFLNLYSVVFNLTRVHTPELVVI